MLNYPSNEDNEQYFHVVLFIMLYKVTLTFKSVNENPVCDHSNECYCRSSSFMLLFMLYKMIVNLNSRRQPHVGH